jgi:hypothetical protein
MLVRIVDSRRAKLAVCYVSGEQMQSVLLEIRRETFGTATNEAAMHCILGQ